MRKMFLLTALLLTAVMAMAAPWSVVKEASESFNAYDVHYFDASNGILVGAYGSIYSTSDGGLTTTAIMAEDETKPSLTDVDFATANVGFAIGDDGLIMRTTDGGATWADVSDGTITFDYGGVAAVTEMVIYVCGDDSTMLKSTDGGTTWVKSDYGFQGQDLDGGIAFYDENHGAVISDGVGGFTWYTADGGTTWTPVEIASVFPITAISSRLYDIDAAGGTIVIGGYHNTTFVSTDGGASYVLSGPYSFGYDYIKTVVVLDDNNIIVTGSAGWMVKTTDAGANWTNLTYNTGNTPSCMAWVDADTGFLYAANGQYFSTSDAGATWTALNEWPAVSFWGIGIPDENTVVLSAFGGGETSKSVDGGMTWSYPTNISTGYTSSLYEIEFADATTGIVAGTSGNLFKSTDAGDSFVLKDNPMYNLSNKHINALTYLSNGDALAGGSSGIIIRSTDGGETWTQNATAVAQTVYDICEVSPDFLVAGQGSGQIGYSVDGGDNWTLALDYGSMLMRSVSYRNGVLLVGASTGIIYRTESLDSTGLATLTTVHTHSAGDDFYEVEWVTDNVAYAVGEHGALAYTEDAGLTWTEEEVVRDVTLQKVVYGGNRLWAVGQNGTILVKDFTPITGIVVNEFLASNDASVTDDAGDYEDFIEFINTNDFDVNIGGWYITDDLTEQDKYMISDTNAAATTIPAGGYLVLWCDDEAEEGDLHVGIKLSAGGEAIGLSQPLPDGLGWVDSLTFGEQITDTSYGQLPDLSGTWAIMPPTPGEANHAFPVSITFAVDMSYKIDTGVFNPASDFMDIAGSFNDWGTNSMVCLDNDGDSVYVVSIELLPGTAVEYKFRINGNWDTSEFPSGGPNRTYTVADNDETVLVWYNDEEPPTSITEGLPESYALYKNYPNPFNPTTTLRYDLPENSLVTLTIYNIMGQEVRTLINHEMTQAGAHSLVWDATDNAGTKVSSGVYFYRINTPAFQDIQRMVYLK